MIDIDSALRDRYPDLFKKYPDFISKSTICILKKLFCEDKINDFLSKNSHLKNTEFIDAVLKYADFKYNIDTDSMENIPKSGRIIFISNHPLGGLDALSLMSLISKVRKDVKILANEILVNIKPISDMLIPVDNINGKSSRNAIKMIDDTLKDEGAIIIFPAGEVSRARPFGIKDSKWNGGFLKFAKKRSVPIVPIHINAKNSPLFYIVSLIHKPLGGLLLGREIFNKKGKSLSIKVGEIIPYKNIIMPEINHDNNTLKLLKKHLYNIGKNKKDVFKTQKCIANKSDKEEVAKEISQGEILGHTKDGKKIYLCQTPQKSPLLLEIGRLREFTFRKVGEGTGKAYDIDEFDLYYKHLILFDEIEKEIVGAYRIGETNTILPNLETERLYTQTLFDFSSKASFLLRDSAELGRSFVQPKFWGSRALDYLWYGIGAYLVNYPQTKFLFGPVSISASYPKTARDMMIFFYKKHFNKNADIVISKNPYIIAKQESSELEKLFNASTYEEDFKILKDSLAIYNLSVPTLYRQYSELCDEGGVNFLDFGLDAEFDDCADGFIVIETALIKDVKKQRYIGSNLKKIVN
ncbi:MAG: lysophospholipid acyltransferase family protein [Campylobacter sp.]|nr:lysophospholipid acyltransferase family protein [Campylobacter sp.]